MAISHAPSMDVTLEAIIGPALLRSLGDVFDDMETAEQEIEAAQKRYPDRADVIWRSFKILRRPETLVADPMYLSHVRELIERVAKGEDTRPATASELLLVFSETSLVSPLNKTGTLAYAWLMERAFPGHDLAQGLVITLRAQAGRESYPGAITEMIEGVRKRLFSPERVIDETPKHRASEYSQPMLVQ